MNKGLIICRLGGDLTRIPAVRSKNRKSSSRCLKGASSRRCSARLFRVALLLRLEFRLAVLFLRYVRAVGHPAPAFLLEVVALALAVPLSAGHLLEPDCRRAVGSCARGGRAVRVEARGRVVGCVGGRDPRGAHLSLPRLSRT